jgi:hypothetical protein
MALYRALMEVKLANLPKSDTLADWGATLPPVATSITEIGPIARDRCRIETDLLRSDDEAHEGQRIGRLSRAYHGGCTSNASRGLGEVQITKNEQKLFEEDGSCETL